MNEEPQKSFFQRFRLPIVIGAPLLIIVAVVAIKLAISGSKAPPRHQEQIVMIKLPPLPPPPPPPPPPPQMTPPPEKMQEQVPVDKPEEKPKEKPPEEPAPLATNLKGDGPADGFGLGAGSGNGGSGLGQGGGSGSRWGWYAGQVQAKIADALRSNHHTRTANLNIKIRVWADSAGRITRVMISGSSGDPTLDRAIQSEALAGLQLQEPPPAGMPMPIVMHISAKRPS